MTIPLTSCPGSDKVDPEDLTSDLIGRYHGEDPVGFPGSDLAKFVYDVEVSRAKVNEINLKISRRYYFRQFPNEPYTDTGATPDRYFENGKVTETKRFIIQETRPTEWSGNENVRTEIYIEGKLTGTILALVGSYKFPVYGDEETFNVNLERK